MEAEGTGGGEAVVVKRWCRWASRATCGISQGFLFRVLACDGGERMTCGGVGRDKAVGREAWLMSRCARVHVRVDGIKRCQIIIAYVE